MNDQLYRKATDRERKNHPDVEMLAVLPVKPMKRFGKYDIYLREPPEIVDAALKGTKR